MHHATCQGQAEAKQSSAADVAGEGQGRLPARGGGAVRGHAEVVSLQLWGTLAILFLYYFVLICSKSNKAEVFIIF